MSASITVNELAEPLTITVKGLHPYTPLRGSVSLDIAVESHPPGGTSQWVSLSSALVIGAALDARTLLGMLWDLRGEPLQVGRPRRQPAKYCVVIRGSHLEVWRAKSECRHSLDYEGDTGSGWMEKRFAGGEDTDA